ncbi:unnamed protein product [Oikopleura dioica]|uniref:Uncharacterized protein n=1 Tax=Oikopleura dioica TaxID=34765 RepID=E4Y5M6_OIKDI|nr:unnamed protein product [Oikopleura dioica]
MITKIIDSKLLRIWSTAFSTYKKKINRILGRRGRHILETIELITLTEMQDRYAEPKNNDWKNLDRANDSVSNEELTIWHNAFKNIIKTSIKNSKGPENELLDAMVETGASCRTVLSLKEKLSRMLPIEFISPELKITQQNRNHTHHQIDSAVWIIKNLARRDRDIWEQKRYSSYEVSVNPSEHSCKTTFSSTPAAEFGCYKGNKCCTSRVLSWFNPDQNDLLISCSALCKKEELNVTSSTTIDSSQHMESNSTLPTMEELETPPMSSDLSRPETSSSSLECILIKPGLKRKRILNDVSSDDEPQKKFKDSQNPGEWE